MIDHQHFEYGDLVVIEDHKARRSLIRLEAGGKINTHVGSVDSLEIVGRKSGSMLITSSGRRLFVLAPTLTDYVLEMPRGAQVIYPKDLAAILFRLEIFPGCKILESGVGSGALSTALARLGVEVTGVEVREDYLNLARKNVLGFLGEPGLERVHHLQGDIYLAAPPGPFDAVVLDVPEPWRALASVRQAISDRGVLCVYVTNVTQLSRVNDALAEHDFGYSEAVELLERQWYLKGLVARPHHRMVGHTGFLLTARPMVKPKRESSSLTLDSNGEEGLGESSESEDIYSQTTLDDVEGTVG